MHNGPRVFKLNYLVDQIEFVSILDNSSFRLNCLSQFLLVDYYLVPLPPFSTPSVEVINHQIFYPPAPSPQPPWHRIQIDRPWSTKNSGN